MNENIKKFFSKSKVKGNNLNQSDLWVFVTLLILKEKGITQLKDEQLERHCGKSKGIVSSAKRKLKLNGLLSYRVTKNGTKYTIEDLVPEVPKPIPEFVKRDRENPDALHYKKEKGNLTMNEVVAVYDKLPMPLKSGIEALAKEEKTTVEVLLKDFYKQWTEIHNQKLHSKSHVVSALPYFIAERRKQREKIKDQNKDGKEITYRKASNRWQP